MKGTKEITRKNYAAKEAKKSHNRSGARARWKKGGASYLALSRTEGNERGNDMSKAPAMEMVFAASSLARSGKSEVRAEGTVSASFPVN